MRLFRLLPVAAIGVLTAQLNGQTPQRPMVSNAALMANDHYTRSHDYDLIHQRIAVSHFNWDSLSFDGTVTTLLVARKPQLDAIILDEGALLQNIAIVDRSGHRLASSRHGDTLVVMPFRSVGFGDSLSFTITYHGRVNNGQGLTFITNDGLTHRPDQIWSQGEDHNNHDWFPTYDFPNDKMTWELAASVPSRFLAVSNGKLVSNLVTGGVRTVTWRQDSPASTYLVSLIVAPLVMTHDSWQGIPVDYYTYREDSTKAWRLFHVTPDMIDVYSRLTGIRYPWAKYSQTTVADFFGGMENVSATTLVDWLPDDAAYRDRPWYQHDLIPHELAHQWFGDYVTTENWANMWLNEGFAEFMPGQYWLQKLGVHAEEDYYLNEYDQFTAIEPQRSMPLASLGSNNIYPKGALVLKMLKDYLGDERFWAGIHEYLRANALSTATSDDLRQAVLRATGENLDWFWNEWVYGAGLPEFTVSANYDAAGRRLTIAVHQTQADTFTVDSTGRRFDQPSIFRMPVTIRIGLKGGDRYHRVDLDARDQNIVIDSVDSAPTMVVFDAGNRILKRLSFEQPVRWLAEQLARDDDLWDRRWAIRQLATHHDDPDAVFALTRAATLADYPLTRAQAVEALSGFPQSVAMGAYNAAARDTSSTVRAAVYTALMHMSGDNVAALARDAALNDSSYQVRAAALGALVHADPAHAHEAILRGLRTPSFQDVVQDAAITAAFRTGDTTAVMAIDSLVASLPNAAHALAAFAGRGNTQAMRLLTAHLNDPRAAIRDRAVSAFRQTMVRINRSAALQQLKATVSGITNPATKRDVEGLIADLEKH